MTHLPRAGEWLAAPLLALWWALSLGAQTPADAGFLSTLGEMREASYSDKADIAEKLVRLATTAYALFSRR